MFSASQLLVRNDGFTTKDTQLTCDAVQPGSWSSSVSIVFDYRVDDRYSIPGRGEGFFL
jgi:hypothetical protein